MSRLACLLSVSFLSACTDPSSLDAGVSLSFPEVPDGGAEIPYRRAGQFTVLVAATIPGLRGPTHATVDITDPANPTGAVRSATATLVEQPDGGLNGSVTLSWPPGGPVPLVVQAAGVVRSGRAPLRLPELTEAHGDAVQTGAERYLPVCIEASAVDGSIEVHLERAVVRGTTSPDTVAMLLPGQCSGAASLERSSARLQVTVGADPPPRLTAQLVNVPSTRRTFDLPVPPDQGFELEVTPSVPSPAPLSIVQLTITATSTTGAGPPKGIAVSLQAVPPTVAIVPSTVTTDMSGNAAAWFQMPENGDVFVIATSGNVRGEATVR